MHNDIYYLWITFEALMGKGGADFEYFIYCWVMSIAPGDQYSLILTTFYHR